MQPHKKTIRDEESAYDLTTLMCVRVAVNVLNKCTNIIDRLSAQLTITLIDFGQQSVFSIAFIIKGIVP